MGVDEARRLDEVVPAHLCAIGLRGQRPRRIMNQASLEHNKARFQPRNKEQVSLHCAKHESRRCFLVGMLSQIRVRSRSHNAMQQPHIDSCHQCQPICQHDTDDPGSNLLWCFVCFIGARSVFVLNFANMKGNSSSIESVLIRIMNSYDEQRMFSQVYSLVAIVIEYSIARLILHSSHSH